uniref:ABC transporter B family member 26, chloroplastic n=1 Tax=Anthurium amnicola TaxID=1678845 RepID=A0A1D1ZBF8_9ARAE
MASPPITAMALRGGGCCSITHTGPPRSNGCRPWHVSPSLSILSPLLSSRLLRRRSPHHYQRHHHKTWIPSAAAAPVALFLPRFSRCRRLSPPRAASSSASSLQRLGNAGDGEGGTRALGILDRLRTGLALLRSVFPGGSWWALEEIAGGGKEKRVRTRQKDLSVLFALGRMWQLVAADRWIIYAGFATLLLAALSDISLPHFLAASIFSAQSGDSISFYRSAKLLVLLCFTSGICSGLRGCFFGIGNMILVKRMREIVFSALIFQDICFFDEKTVGNLSSRLGADCQQVSQVIGNDLNMISRNVLQGSGALIYLFILSWPLALSTLVICFVLAIIMIFHGQYQKKAAKSTQDITASANEVTQEVFSLIRTVRAFGTEKQESERYMKWLKKLADISLRQSVAYGFWNLSFGFLYHSTQVVAVLVGGASMMAGHFSAEQLTKFILYSEWLIYATWRMADNWSSLLQSIGASEEVFKLMDLLPSKEFLTEGLKLQKLTGHVEFVNVSFYYPSRKTIPVLQNINLTVFPNEVIAIVGLSGSGKSTLVNLLLNLYEPTSGQVLVDGFPVKDLDIKWLRGRIGYVGQEPRLFRMDISSNIKYGCTRKINHEDVEFAAKQAFAHEFILSLPNGYETLVDDDLLSGGQKQRIAIARAILRDPDILILDEATSALDAESEHYVKRLLHSVQSGSKIQRTVIVIAHRLSTIQSADRIIVMDSGNIVEMGNHLKLLSKNGIYARLTERQTDTIT